MDFRLWQVVRPVARVNNVRCAFCRATHVQIPKGFFYKVERRLCHQQETGPASSSSLANQIKRPTGKRGQRTKLANSRVNSVCLFSFCPSLSFFNCLFKHYRKGLSFKFGLSKRSRSDRLRNRHVSIFSPNRYCRCRRFVTDVAIAWRATTVLGGTCHFFCNVSQKEKQEKEELNKRKRNVLSTFPNVIRWRSDRLISKMVDALDIVCVSFTVRVTLLDEKMVIEWTVDG